MGAFHVMRNVLISNRQMIELNEGGTSASSGVWWRVLGAESCHFPDECFENVDYSVRKVWRDFVWINIKTSLYGSLNGECSLVVKKARETACRHSGLEMWLFPSALRPCFYSVASPPGFDQPQQSPPFIH